MLIRRISRYPIRAFVAKPFVQFVFCSCYPVQFLLLILEEILLYVLIVLPVLRNRVLFFSHLAVFPCPGRSSYRLPDTRLSQKPAGSGKIAYARQQCDGGICRTHPGFFRRR